MYKVGFTRQAIKSLRKIPLDYQQKIQLLSSKLKDNPFQLDIKKLTPPNKTSHRLRVGSYRVLLDIDVKAKEIIIVDIERRTTRTYHLKIVS